MTNVAKLLLDGIDEDAIDFRATYDGEAEEPVLLPGGFPNLLANGAQGIAVGWPQQSHLITLLNWLTQPYISSNIQMLQLIRC